MAPTLPTRPTVTLTAGDGPPVLVTGVTATAPEFRRSEAGPGATRPDERWRLVDGAGHVHTWASVPLPRRQLLPEVLALLPLPSLQHAVRILGRLEERAPRWEIPTAVASRRHIPCDGTCSDLLCEGYDVTVWHCRACGEEIAPGYRPDPGAYVEYMVTGGTLQLELDDWPFGQRAVYSHDEDLRGVLEEAGQRVPGRLIVTGIEHSAGRACSVRVLFLADVDRDPARHDERTATAPA